jgi:CRP-like cAMP-binding protein
VSPRASATAHELARVAMLAGLPGETLARLAKQMTREELAPGKGVAEEGERFYIVLSGMLSGGPGTILRPGGWFGDIEAGTPTPRAAAVRAMTPATVASCDRATFDELLRPVFEQG